MGPWRARGVMALRLIIFSLIALTLADPSIRVPDNRLSVVFAVDVSESVPPDQQAVANEWVRQAISYAGPEDRAVVIAFADGAVVQRFGLQSTPPPATIAPAASATDISAALRLAGDLATGTGGRRLVLLTDGWETRGHAEELAQWLRTRQAHVSYVPLAALSDGPEIALRSLEVPPFARQGDKVDATLIASSNVETDVMLRLLVDGQPDLETVVHVVPGTNRLGLSHRVDTTGVHTLTAEVRSDLDTRAENNRADALLVVKDRPRVLVIEDRQSEGADVARLLTSDGMEVATKPASTIATSPAALRDYDAVVLNNISATSLTLDQQKTLQSYVRDMGRGLVMAGGGRSFSMGAYAGTTLEEMSPVLSTPPIRREKGNVALTLVIDKSGSMDLSSRGVSKVQMAKEAAIQATEVLRPGDIVGVLAFDTANYWVVPPQPLDLAGGLAAVQARIASITADGGTDIYKALETAYQAQPLLDASFKHIILLTDGQSWSSDYEGLVQRNRDLNVTLSTVAIGNDADTQLLARLARLGDGRYYFTERFEDIPRIVTKETTIATRSALAEGEFYPRAVDPSPLLRGFDAGDLPPVLGYVVTTPRPRATVALASDRNDPILAHWQYGLGRVVAWTPDVQPGWARPWLEWPQGASFFSQAVRWTMATPVEPDLRVDAQVEGRSVTLHVESLQDDGSFGEGLDTRAVILTPGQRAVEVPVPQSGPGQYQVRLAVDEPGLYQVAVTQAGPSQQPHQEIIGFAVDGQAELRAVGTNEPLLRSLAGQTGGRQLQLPSEAFSRDFQPGSDRWLPVWPQLLLVALLLFPADVALRRLHLPIRGLSLRRPGRLGRG